MAKIFFSDIQSVTLNYHTPRHMVMMVVIVVNREEERRRQNAAAEERGEKLERENNLLKLKVLLFISRCFGLYYSWSCQVEILLDMLAQKTAETSLQV